MNFDTILFILRDSIAGTVFALRTGYPVSRGSIPGMEKYFFFCTSKVSGAHPALVFDGLPGLFPEDKAAGS